MSEIQTPEDKMKLLSKKNAYARYKNHDFVVFPATDEGEYLLVSENPEPKLNFTFDKDEGVYILPVNRDDIDFGYEIQVQAVIDGTTYNIVGGTDETLILVSDKKINENSERTAEQDFETVIKITDPLLTLVPIELPAYDLRKRPIAKVEVSEVVDMELGAILNELNSFTDSQVKERLKSMLDRAARNIKQSVYNNEFENRKKAL